MKNEEYTVIGIRTDSHKKLKTALRKDRMAPDMRDAVSEAVEEWIKNRYFPPVTSSAQR